MPASPEELQLASPLPSAHALQVIPQGVTPSPCIPCCLVIAADRLFTCHEDCQTSFFRSLGTAKLADVSAVATEPGKEYCVLVSWVDGGGAEEGVWRAGPAEGTLPLLTWGLARPRSLPRTASSPSHPGSST